MIVAQALTDANAHDATTGIDLLDRADVKVGALFHTERPLQGLGNELISATTASDSSEGEVVETERLGGLLRSYERAA